MKKENGELKNYYIYLIGQFVSRFGSRMTSYALTLWMYKQSGSVLSTAILMACYLVPEIFLNFIAGSLSDKWDKKKILLITDSIAACATCSILVFLINDSMNVYYLYVVNIILGISDAFQSPTSEVVTNLMISKENYIKISAIESFSQSFISIFYPIIATAIYSFFGLNLILWIDLLTFLFAFITLLLFVRIPNIKNDLDKKESFFEICHSGVLYIIKTEGLKELILFMAFVNLIVAMYSTNLSPMVLSRTNQQDLQLGVVSSMAGISGLVGSFFVGKSKNVSNRVNLATSIIAYSFLVGNTLLGIGRHYLVWALAVFLSNSFVPIFNAQIGYLMRENVPNSMQGRVFSARNTLQYSMIPVGNLISGFLSDQVFEPFMQGDSFIVKQFCLLVGKGPGSGIGLLYVLLAIIGYFGCLGFKRNKRFQKLNK